MGRDSSRNAENGIEATRKNGRNANVRRSTVDPDHLSDNQSCSNGFVCAALRTTADSVLNAITIIIIIITIIVVPTETVL
jgi:hypothetical protein